MEPLQVRHELRERRAAPPVVRVAQESVGVLQPRQVRAGRDEDATRGSMDAGPERPTQDGHRREEPSTRNAPPHTPSLTSAASRSSAGPGVRCRTSSRARSTCAGRVDYTDAGREVGLSHERVRLLARVTCFAIAERLLVGPHLEGPRRPGKTLGVGRSSSTDWLAPLARPPGRSPDASAAPSSRASVRWLSSFAAPPRLPALDGRAGDAQDGRELRLGELVRLAEGRDLRRRHVALRAGRLAAGAHAGLPAAVGP